MRLLVESMDLDDIPEVIEVDRECYTLPWPASAYRREILHNRNARYLVLRHVEDGEREAALREPERSRFTFGFLWRAPKSDDPPRSGTIIGYAGMWLMVDEAHITTIAVRHSWRRRGLGELLLASLVETAADMGAHRLTLEVRVSNDTAQALYCKYGFNSEGVRPRYYSDNNEDAYIMTTPDIREPAYQSMLDGHINLLQRRLERDVGLSIRAPGVHIRATPEEAGTES